MRDIERRDGPSLQASEVTFNASFILGGQIRGEEMRLFRIYAEGNFIESGALTPYIQTGETKYGKPIIDRVITTTTNLADAAKCVLVSFDSTMRSNVSVGMPIDLICYERDSLAVTKRRRFEEGDAYFNELSRDWMTHPTLTHLDAPQQIDVVLVNGDPNPNRPDLPHYGAGEAAMKPTIAAVANAIFDATGVRMRRVPFRKERVLAALNAANA